MNKVLILFLLLSTWGLMGQSYISAGGIRMGTGIGFTFQQAVERHTTIEGILNSSLRSDQIQITILGERHFPLVSRRFNMYTGAGFHKAWNVQEKGSTATTNPFGLSFILGAEMTISKLILSYDFKPAIHLQGHKAFDFQTAVSLRYVFKRKTIREQIKEGHQKRKKKRVKARKKRKNERAKGKSSKKKINWWFWE